MSSVTSTQRRLRHYDVITGRSIIDIAMILTLTMLVGQVNGVRADFGVEESGNATETVRPTCAVSNWENMTCTWPTTADVNLTLRAYNRYTCNCSTTRVGSGQCPQPSKGSCTWSSTFKQNDKYCLWLMTDEGRVHSCTQFDTAQLVKPNSVEDIKVTTVTSKSSRIEWTIPSRRYPSRCRVRAHLNSTLREREIMVDFVRRPSKRVVNEGGVMIQEQSFAKWVSIDLVDLTPYTWYDVIVDCIPILDSRETAGNWSDTSKVNFTTAEDVPAMPPTVTSGSFTRRTSGHTQRVEVHWKSIPVDQRNGVIVNNHVECCSLENITNTSSTCSSVNVGNDRFSAVVQLDTEADYGCTIRSATSKGNSSASQRIVVLRKDDAPARPNGFVVLYDGMTTTATWISNNSSFTDRHFTVYWCSRQDGGPDECHGSLDWATVTGNTFSRTFSESPSTYRFAISTEDVRPGFGVVSSGLAWTSCVRDRYDDSVAKPIVNTHQPYGRQCIVVKLTKSNACYLTGYYVIEHWLHTHNSMGEVHKRRVEYSNHQDAVVEMCDELIAGVEYRMRVTSWLSLGQVEYYGVVDHSPVVLRGRPVDIVMYVITATALVCVIVMIFIIRSKWRFMVNRFHIPITIPDGFIKVNVGSVYLQSGCSSVTDSTSAGELTPTSGISPTSITCHFDFSSQCKPPSSDFDGRPLLTRITPALDQPVAFVLPQIPNDDSYSRNFFEKETFCNYASNLIFSAVDDEEESVADDEAEQDGYSGHYVTRLPDGRLSMAPKYASRSADDEDDEYGKMANYYITLLLNSDEDVSSSSRLDVDEHDVDVNYVRDLVFDEMDEVDEEELTSTSYGSSIAHRSAPPVSISHATGIDNNAIRGDPAEEPDLSDSYCVVKMI